MADDLGFLIIQISPLLFMTNWGCGRRLFSQNSRFRLAIFWIQMLVHRVFISRRLWWEWFILECNTLRQLCRRQQKHYIFLACGLAFSGHIDSVAAGVTRLVAFFVQTVFNFQSVEKRKRTFQKPAPQGTSHCMNGQLKMDTVCRESLFYLTVDCVVFSE